LLRVFGDILHDPEIFHLTRRSAAGGVAAGLFVSFLPVPGHTLIAALAAIWLRVNLPLAVLGCWLTNPLTITPLFYLAYRNGALLLGRPLRAIEFEFSFHWLSTTLLDIWQPFLLGCLVTAGAIATAGYFSVLLLWRLAIVVRWRERKRMRRTVTGGNREPDQVD